MSIDIVLVAILFILIIVCAITDLMYHKIYNYLTLPTIIIALGLNLLSNFTNPALGLYNFKMSIISAVIGFGVIFVVFIFGGMGGGDVKYMAAIGALDPFHHGHNWIIWVFFYSALTGGLISIVVMVMRGKLFNSLKNIFRVMLTFLTPTLEQEPLKKEDSIMVPFGFGISVGTLFTTWLFFMNYLP
jgi:prepilin peptidase CpaA